MPYFKCTGLAQSGGGGTDLKDLIEGTLTTITTDATAVKKYLFYNDTVLTSFTGLSCVDIGNYSFRGCTNLQTFVCGTLTAVADQACYNMGKTGSTFDLTFNGTVGGEAFRQAKIKKALGNITSLGSGAFRDCTTLIECHFSGASLQNLTFSGCTALADLYLTNSGGVVNIINTNALQNVPRTCKVHVPSSLLASYQSATTWQDFDLVAI